MVDYVSPTVDAASFYGGSMELTSCFVPQSMLENPQSIQCVVEAIWEGLQVATAPLKDRPAGVFDSQVSVILFGNKQYCNQTGVGRDTWCTSTSESLNTILQHQCHDRVNVKGDSNNANAAADRPVEKRWNLMRPDGVVWHERTSQVVHVSPKIPVAKSLSQP